MIFFAFCVSFCELLSFFSLVSSPLLSLALPHYFSGSSCPFSLAYPTVDFLCSLSSALCKPYGVLPNVRAVSCTILFFLVFRRDLFWRSRHWGRRKKSQSMSCLRRDAAAKKESTEPKDVHHCSVSCFFKFAQFLQFSCFCLHQHCHQHLHQRSSESPLLPLPAYATYLPCLSLIFTHHIVSLHASTKNNGFSPTCLLANIVVYRWLKWFLHAWCLSVKVLSLIDFLIFFLFLIFFSFLPPPSPHFSCSPLHSSSSCPLSSSRTSLMGCMPGEPCLCVLLSFLKWFLPCSKKRSFFKSLRKSATLWVIILLSFDCLFFVWLSHPLLSRTSSIHSPSLFPLKWFCILDNGNQGGGERQGEAASQKWRARIRTKKIRKRKKNCRSVEYLLDLYYPLLDLD